MEGLLDKNEQRDGGIQYLGMDCSRCRRRGLHLFQYRCFHLSLFLCTGLSQMLVFRCVCLQQSGMGRFLAHRKRVFFLIPLSLKESRANQNGNALFIKHYAELLNAVVVVCLP